MNKYINIIVLIVLLIISSCTAKIHKSGFNNIDKLSTSLIGLNKKEIIDLVGYPSNIDKINNNFIYFNEVKKEKNIFNKKIISRNIYVIYFDKNDYFSNLEFYEMNDQNKIKISKKTTNTNIVESGLIERIFGGVGLRQKLPTN